MKFQLFLGVISTNPHGRRGQPSCTIPSTAVRPRAGARCAPGFADSDLANTPPTNFLSPPICEILDKSLVFKLVNFFYIDLVIYLINPSTFEDRKEYAVVIVKSEISMPKKSNVTTNSKYGET